MRYVTLVSRLLRVTLVCFRFVWAGLKVTPSPHQEHAAGFEKVAEGQMRHTTPYHTSLRPPMSTGGRHLKDTPPSALSYSQDRETGADGGAGQRTEGRSSTYVMQAASWQRQSSYMKQSFPMTQSCEKILQYSIILQ